ncbi:IS3 family transposase [Palleronia rufa]|uniref:IS3 family transposase n=1 Tax=Palleronia rufa TaxID=1530186 RepID=UPI0009E056C2
MPHLLNRRWRIRLAQIPQRADGHLSERIGKIHVASKTAQGAPRIHVGVANQGFSVGRKPVERHMRAAALLGVRHREGTRPTIRGDRVRLANDLVNRNFGAHAPDRPMVADITYGPTWAGFNRGFVVPGAGPRCIWAGQWATTSRCSWLVMP